jgi:GNAT superfamily N-acetyltransferase/uncharacterized glyoxalase superfamily protein PhnB
MRLQSFYPIIVTDELAACRDFYQRWFGLAVVFEARWFVLLGSSEAGAAVAFMRPDHPSAPPGPEPFSGKGMCLEFEVGDARAEYGRFVAGGAPLALPLRDEPFGQRRFGLFDPAGVWIDVVEQIDSAPGWWDRYTGDAGVEVRREEIGSAVAGALILALNVELSGRYPEAEARHFRLDAEEVADGRGAFLVAYRTGKAVGCGAIRRIAQDTAEIKRMYVDPRVRGQGVGRALVAALEAEARRLGVTRLVLETGDRQPEAIALYARLGFARIPPFGEYVGTPSSLCMSKSLE